MYIYICIYRCVYVDVYGTEHFGNPRRDASADNYSCGGFRKFGVCCLGVLTATVRLPMRGVDFGEPLLLDASHGQPLDRVTKGFEEDFALFRGGEMQSRPGP